jgi:small subunit ribosomal protein S8
MTDPIADMLTRIRNAQMARKSEVSIPYSKLKMQLAQIMLREGYLESVAKNEDAKFSEIIIKLKYEDRNTPKIRSLRRVSKSGRRIYVSHDKLPRVLGGLGLAIVTTSKGLLTNKEAVAAKIGGEVICEIF